MRKLAITLGTAAIMAVPTSALAAPAIPPITPGQVVAASDACPEARESYSEARDTAKADRKQAMKTARVDFVAAVKAATKAKKAGLKAATTAAERAEVKSDFRQAM